MKNRKLVELRGTRTLLTVATDLGISVSALSQYEHGKRFPGREIAKKIAAYYKTTVDDLFYNQSFTGCEMTRVSGRPHTFNRGGGT